MIAGHASTESPLEKGTQNKTEATMREYETTQLGVYQVTFGDKGDSLKRPIPGKEQLARVKSVVATFPYIRWFLMEIYRLGPEVLLALWMAEFLISLAPAAKLYSSNWLLQSIEQRDLNGQIDLPAVRNALVAHVSASILETLLHRAMTKLDLIIESRASMHFELLSIRATLSRPLSTSDTGNEAQPSSQQMKPWRTFKLLNNFIFTSIQCTGQVVFLVQIALANELGRTFLLLWLVRVSPLFSDRQKLLWSRGCIYAANNLEYLRLRALSKLALSTEYRQEILAGNLGGWIIGAYQSARARFGDLPTARPYGVISQESHPFSDVVNAMVDDWPTLYYGASTLLGYTPFSFSAIATFQTATQSLGHQLHFLFKTSEGSLFATFGRIKDLALSLEVQPDADANDYPNAETSDSAGMSLQLRNISLTYPGSKSSQPAVRDLSCEIKPGHLVVIVGANGSGKTSLVKLFTRLYNPSSGSILVDGREASSYKLTDLRNATALLSQDHSIFPLSLLENIGLGDPAANFDEDSIRRAAEKGGASGFIEKLDHKYNTVLEPVSTKGCMGLTLNHPLIKKYEALEARSNVSGGERQRIVASRTLMRIASDDVRLVVVDEPSSAMDPAGEYDLFKRLRECRAGKTMIFITHRFGHLTKHADIILCMKDGVLVEQGTHKELLALNGEYSTLYNIQAQAFTPVDG